MILSVFLDPIQQLVCRRGQGIIIRIGAKVDDAADAGGDMLAAGRIRMNVVKRRLRFLQPVHHVMNIGHADCVDDEFITAHTHDDICLTEVLLQCMSDLSQGLVTGGVSVMIVDVLEIIDIDQHESTCHSIRDIIADQVLSAAPVVQSGERVVICLIRRGEACFHERS